MKNKFLWIVFFLIGIQLSYPKPLSFAFLGVKTDHQPDFAEKLENKILEKLQDLKKLDQFSTKEISDLQIKGLLPKQLPSEDEAHEISLAFGPMLVSSVYLNKIIQDASNNLWPPFSVDMVYKVTAELAILETLEGRILYYGKINSSSSFRKYFTVVTSPTKKPLLDAVDRNTVLAKIISDLSEKSAIRIKQVIADFSFPE